MEVVPSSLPSVHTSKCVHWEQNKDTPPHPKKQTLAYTIDNKEELLED
jgi:hypothetical protein